MARVVTSDVAVDLINRLRSEIGLVNDAMQTMLRTGNELTNPQVWEGVAANQFRDGDWADTQSWASASVDRLHALQDAVDRVNQAIQEAGGGLG